MKRITTFGEKSPLRISRVVAGASALNLGFLQQSLQEHEGLLFVEVEAAYAERPE